MKHIHVCLPSDDNNTTSNLILIYRLIGEDIFSNLTIFISIQCSFFLKQIQSGHDIYYIHVLHVKMSIFQAEIKQYIFQNPKEYHHCMSFI